MKKFFLLLFSIIIFCIPVFANSEKVNCNLCNTCTEISNYKETDTISLKEYLYLKKTKRDLKSLKLNHNGDVIFKNKVVLTNKGVPLNDDTAYTNEELKILFTAKGIKPKENCNPNDVLNNGSLGCFIDNPDEK